MDESLVPGCFEARKIFAEKQRAKREAERTQREAEEAAYVKERNEAAQKEVAQAIETLKSGGCLVNFDVEIFKSRYHSSSYSIFNYLARQYGVKIPIKTQGWINSSLLDITVKDGKMSGGHMSGKNQSTVIYKYMNQLIEAVGIVSQDRKTGLWYAHMRGYQHVPVSGSFSEKRRDAAEYAKMYNGLPHKVDEIERKRREAFEKEMEKA